MVWHMNLTGLYLGDPMGSEAVDETVVLGKTIMSPRWIRFVAWAGLLKLLVKHL